MNPLEDHLNSFSRRSFLGLTGLGLGAIAAKNLLAADMPVPGGAASLSTPPHFAPGYRWI